MPNLIINKRNIGKSAFQLPEQAYVNLIFENIIIPRQVSEQSNRSLEDEQFEDQIISTQLFNLDNTLASPTTILSRKSTPTHPQQSNSDNQTNQILNETTNINTNNSSNTTNNQKANQIKELEKSPTKATKPKKTKPATMTAPNHSTARLRSDNNQATTSSTPNEKVSR